MEIALNQNETFQTPPWVPSSLSNEKGGIGQIIVILVLLALLAVVGLFFFKMRAIPGAATVFSLGGMPGKTQVLKAIVTGQPLAAGLVGKIKKEKGTKERLAAFEAKLVVIREKDTDFMFSEGRLVKVASAEQNINKYFEDLRVYMNSIYKAYPVKKSIPADLLIEKISEFPEEKVLAFIVCNAGLPRGKAYDYMVYHLFKHGFEAQGKKKKQEAGYLLEVLYSVINLRSDWYNSFFSDTKLNPEKSAGLQLIWNFLNAYKLPQDLIKNKEYYKTQLG